MIFSDKISHNNLDSENAKRSNENGPQLDHFPFSALHFLRNRLMPTEISQCYTSPGSFPSQALPPLETILPLAKISMQSKHDAENNNSSLVKPPNISPQIKSPVLMNSPASIFCNNFLRRPRGEKRPIPEEQKDEKYFERRKRNNEAAKKSRDARKMREDRVNCKLIIFNFYF
jgi:hypothetical protein